MATLINKCIVIAFVSIEQGGGKTTLIKNLAYLFNKYFVRKNQRGIILDIPGYGYRREKKRNPGRIYLGNPLKSALLSVYEAKRKTHPSLWSGKLNFNKKKYSDTKTDQQDACDLNEQLPKHIKPYLKPGIDILSNNPNYPNIIYTSNAEVELVFSQLPSLIDKLRQEYRFILIEMPSSIAMSNVPNKEFLSKINHVIIPFGFDDSFDVISRIETIDKMVKELAGLEIPIVISGIVPMFYVEQDAIDSKTLHVLQNIFQKLVFSAVPDDSIQSSRKIAKAHKEIFLRVQSLVEQLPPLPRTKKLIDRAKLIECAMNEIKNNFHRNPEISERSLKKVSLKKKLSLAEITEYMNGHHRESSEMMTIDKLREAVSISIFKNYPLEYCEDAVMNAWRVGAKINESTLKI